MSNLNVNKIVGDSFEDLDVSEMIKVQGTGDVEVRSTPWCGGLVSASIAIIVSLIGCGGKSTGGDSSGSGGGRYF